MIVLQCIIGRLLSGPRGQTLHIHSSRATSANASIADMSPRRTSGADLTFASPQAANSRSECQIQKLH